MGSSRALRRHFWEDNSYTAHLLVWSMEDALKRFEERLGMEDITFAVTKTTCITFFSYHILLWFAQNTLPLRWQRQQASTNSWWTVCCDLLKIHYLCGNKDNEKQLKHWQRGVVICSKFITFAVTKTTPRSPYFQGCLLWFAQNSLPLR